MKPCKSGCTYSFSSGWRWLGENKKTQWNASGYTPAYVAPTSMISAAWKGTSWLGTLEWKRPRSIAHYARSSTQNPGRGWSTLIVMGTVPVFSLCRPKRRMPWAFGVGFTDQWTRCRCPTLGNRRVEPVLGTSAANEGQPLFSDPGQSLRRVQPCGATTPWSPGQLSKRSSILNSACLPTWWWFWPPCSPCGVYPRGWC